MAGGGPVLTGVLFVAVLIGANLWWALALSIVYAIGVFKLV